MWCIRTIDAEFGARMYKVLDLYEEPYNPKRPLICLDEKPKQMLGGKRMSIPMERGSPEKYDLKNMIMNTSGMEQQTYSWLLNSR
jgi:hypothetical protein